MARREQGPTNAGDTDITQYTWDHRNRLTKVLHRPSYGAAVDWVVRYWYDSQNRLVRKLADLNGDGDYEQKQNLAYDGNQVVMDLRRTGSGLVQTGDLEWRYLWGPAVDQILAEENVDNGADETVQWTLTDHLNTVRDIAKCDSQTGATTVVNHLIYDAFGKVASESNPAVDSLFLFTGRPFDSDTQLQNNLNRWYDSRVGRWLSEDPIGYPFYGSFPLFISSNAVGQRGNLYAYVNNNPVRYVDSTGRMGHIVGGMLVGCGGGTMYSIAHSLLTGDSFCQGCCKAVISCLFGALGGAVAAAAPGYEGCIVGFVSGIAESVSKQLCHYVCGHGENADFTCAVATAIVNGVVGCVVKGMAEAEPSPAGEKVAKWAWQIVSRITGHDIYEICRLTHRAPPPPNRTFACCTFEHKGMWWSETVECSAGQGAQAACASRADGWFTDWKVIAARPGTCT